MNTPVNTTDLALAKRRITIEEYLKEKEENKEHIEVFATVWQLKALLAKIDLPDDTPILYQRIEDSYFVWENNNWWKVVTVWNELCENDSKSDLADEYIEAFCSFSFKNKVLMITAHY